MTTKVTVDAHAGWPVMVTIIDSTGEEQAEIVAPNTKADFYVFDTRKLTIEELKKEDAA
jgi:hypothetical protein